MRSLPALPKRLHGPSIWALYILGFLPAVWGFYLGATGRLPGNAVKEFEHLLGIWALRFLIATLAITPIRDLFGVNWLRYRRALGLLAFYYVMMHFLTYMVLDQTLLLPAIVADIARRPFITIGMAALVLLIPLAVTSNNWSIRRLGQRWNKLHRLVYVIAAAGALHFAMSVKVVGPEQMLYLFLVAVPVAWRAVRKRFLRWRRQGTAPMRSQAERDEGASGEAPHWPRSRNTSPNPHSCARTGIQPRHVLGLKGSPAPQTRRCWIPVTSTGMRVEGAVPGDT
ncbi:sulfite oxidase [Sinorhizobium meliloti CCBAU 01290]|nr:sulfite oxidase [Sinorhizobium meliloti CCBAU 01290]